MTRQEQWIKLDKFRRREFLKAELKKKILKSIIKNTKTSNIVRYLAAYNYTLSSRASSMTQARNRCVWFGRQHMVIKRVKYARFKFRTESYAGNLPGLRRDSW